MIFNLPVENEPQKEVKIIFSLSLLNFLAPSRILKLNLVQIYSEFTLKLYRLGEVPRGKKKKLKDMAQKIAEGIPLSYRKCLRK